MLSVNGYSVGDRIRETPHSEVYAGSRQPDGLPVILKLYLSEACKDGVARAQRELELMQRVRGDGIVRGIEARRCSAGLVLVTERFPGVPLSDHFKHRRPSSAEFLTIALGISRALAAVHDARVIHRDVKLSNVLFDPERTQICLVDFGISTEFGRAEHAAPSRSAEGTMHYIAPEQTGRVGLGVDFRADLYSLGATLYELLIGRPPFQASTPLELIHAHIAAQPRAAADVDGRVPLAVSRIVDKLLEKDPELRYQTARGLASDLEECQKQLAASGAIDEALALGTQDASDRLRFPRKLYGRERETAELVGAFERIAQKGVELVLLTGPAGIGKSSLPGVLRKRVAGTGGYLAEAKFDLNLRKRPYSGLSTIFSALIDQILTESGDRLAAWATLIRQSLGGIGQALVGLAPNLAYVVEDFPPLPPVGAQEARERLSLAVVRFVRAVARPAHPLILFFDDLQWADSESLFLLTALLRSTQLESLLVIGGYRNDEVGENHPLTQWLADLAQTPLPMRTLELAPLELEHTTALLAEVLGRTAQDVEWLARRVGPKSQHNPLLVRRLMFHLWDRNLIRHEHGRGWVWDERSLTEAEITDDAAAVMAARIDALPPPARELIEHASLIGTAFEVEVLVDLANADRLDVLQQLMALVDQGLIAPCREGFKFVHDRLREAAQTRLSAEELARLHHRAAQLLLERTPPERLPAQAFELAGHVCGAIDRLTDSERPRALEVLRLAGNLALEKGAAATAVHYLGLARSLLSEEDWTQRFELAFDIQMRSAEAAYQTRAFDLALELLDGLEQRPLDALRQARVTAQRISVCVVVRHREVLPLALSGLRRFGIRWSANPSLLRARFEIWRTDRLFNCAVEDFFAVRALPSASWSGPNLIISSAAASMMERSSRLGCMAAAYALRSLRHHGPVGSPGGALAAYALQRIAIRGDLAGAERYALAALHWSQRVHHPPSDVRWQLRRAVLASWLEPRHKVLEPLERAGQCARELGNHEYALYAYFIQMSFAALSGEALPAVARRIDLTSERAGDADMAGYREMYGVLREPTASAIDWDAHLARILERARRWSSGERWARIHWLGILCLMGQFERAAAEVEGLSSQLSAIGHLGSARADYTMFRGLALAALLDRKEARLERWSHLRVLQRCCKELRVWARHGPDFVHMAQLLQAEIWRAKGRIESALREYQTAAQRARDVGHVHHAALCHERRALLLEQGKRAIEAVSAYRTARDLYSEWGALAKVRALDTTIDRMRGAKAGDSTGEV